MVIQFEDADRELDTEQKAELAIRLDEASGGRFSELDQAARVGAMKESMSVIVGFVLLALLVASFLPRGRVARSPGEDAEVDADDRIADRRAGPVPGRGT